MGAATIDFVLVVGQKNIFEFRPRHLRQVTGEAAEQASLLMFHDGKPERGPAFTELPETLHRRIAAGEVGLVFDSSEEGFHHKPQRTDDLHAFMREVGAPMRRGVYLTQDRAYGAAYAAYCKSKGIPERERMSVLYADQWPRRFFNDYNEDGEQVFEERLARFRARAPHRSRKFMSLNFTARPTKLFFLLSLLRDGLWDQGRISFGGFEVRVKPPSRPDKHYIMRQLEDGMRASRGFEDMARELIPLMPQLDSYGQVLLGEMVRHETSGRVIKVPLSDTPISEHDDCWFTVVTETEMLDRVCRFTEKPLKPLANFQPLLTFGNPRSWDFLRELGFQSFEGFIDEAYDREFDPRRRFDMVYAEFQRLCAMDEAQLATWTDSLAEVLTHNARWSLTRLPKLYRDKHDPGLLQAILLAVGLMAPAEAVDYGWPTPFDEG